MRMSGASITRLAGLAAVDPALVTGNVIISGVRYSYRNGVLNYAGDLYAVSDARDFVISSKNVPIGAIINGELVPIDKLSAQQQSYFKRKYGY